MMRNHSMILLSALIMGTADAAPIEGALSSNAAALLVLLGIWALLMGMRNLRELRHKRLVLNRNVTGSVTRHVKDQDPEAHG